MTDSTPAGRVDPPFVTGERAMLDAWLDFHRATLFWKCEGLSGEQLASRSSPPSTLSLLGLVRHMAEVERGWFADFMGLDQTPIYCSEDDPDGDLDNLSADAVEADLETLRREIATYREHAPRFSLDDVRVDDRGRTIGLRWIYLHLIEEYARHNGHADFLREAIDGRTGD